MIQVAMVDRMGSDLSVVNAARVSFSKVKKHIDKSDERLIKYLAKHNHWSPFAHTSAQFRIKAPVFVARQLAKHQVGLVWNEVSRRYVSDDPTVWVPEDGWRKETKDKKQGSSDELISSQFAVGYIYTDASSHALDAYKEMIRLGYVPNRPEQCYPYRSSPSGTGPALSTPLAGCVICALPRTRSWKLDKWRIR